MPAPSRIVYSREKKPRPERARARRFFIASAVLIVIAGLAWGVWRVLASARLAISDVEVMGTSRIGPDAIRDAVRDDLAGRVWLILPRNNYFFVSSVAIQEDLRNRFPQAADVSVEKIFPNTIRVSIRERRLWGVYCASQSATSTPSACFYIDNQGSAFQEFSSIAGFLLPVVWGMASTSVGAQAVVPEAIRFFDDARRVLASINATPIALRMSNAIPDDVILNLSEGWDIRVTRRRVVDEWFSILKTLLDKEVGVNRSRLEYVDLRFGQKVFYKLK